MMAIFLPLSSVEIGILVIVDRRHVISSLCLMFLRLDSRRLLVPRDRASRSCRCRWRDAPRTMATRPVRVSSLMPKGRSISISESTLSSVPVISMVIESRRHIDDLRAKDVDQLLDLAAVGRGGVHLDQRQLADHRVVVGDIGDLGDVDQLVELLDDLLQHGIVGIHHHRHARDARRLAVADGQALDVIVAAAEQVRPHGSGRPGLSSISTTSVRRE